MASNQSVDINDVIKLSQDEEIIKTYEGFESIDPVGKGFFTITNYRFIYYATNSNKFSSSKSFIEWELNQIVGITSEYGKQDSTVHKMFASVLMGIAVAGIFYFLLKLLSKNGKVMWILITSLVLLLIGVILFIFRRRKMFYVEIFTKTPRTSLMSFSSTLYKPSTTERIKIKPNKFTIDMIKELGAAVIEAKQYSQKII